jgi:hypothetical protein
MPEAVKMRMWHEKPSTRRPNERPLSTPSLQEKCGWPGPVSRANLCSPRAQIVLLVVADAF